MALVHSLPSGECGKELLSPLKEPEHPSYSLYLFLCFNNIAWDFPGGPAAKAPWGTRSHMLQLRVHILQLRVLTPQLKIPHAATKIKDHVYHN